MDTIQATFRIVTPMFIGGADQKPDDGIRPPSVKGALRFWWRVLNWACARQTMSCDESALMWLHAEEVRLFGGSAEHGGQGCFLLDVIKHPNKKTFVSDWPVNNTGAGYMAFGILEYGNEAKGNRQLHRQGIVEGEGFTIQLCFHPGTSQEDKKGIDDAINAWGLLGGLGSRSRRGMGSITRLGTAGKLFTTAEYESEVSRLLSGMSGVTLPPYSAISKESCFRILGGNGDAKVALNYAGNLFKQYRGRGSELRGKDKIPFGLPLQKIDDKNRRASPLLFHVHALADGQYVSSVLYLPTSLFHPKHSSVDMSRVAGFACGVAA